MSKKEFVIGLLLRAIPFFVFVVATIIIAIIGMPSDWWGWYVAYVLIFAGIVFVVVYAVRKGPAVAMNSIKATMRKKEAALFLARWDLDEYNRAGVVGYVYQSEKDPDTSLAFHEDDVALKKVFRDEDGNVTGDTESFAYGYDKVKRLVAIDGGEDGSAHLQITFDDGKSVYTYFDVDVAKFMKEKTSLQIEGLDQLKLYYVNMINQQ